MLTVLDPQHAIAEEFEDNNDAAYCVPAHVARLAPEIVAPLGQHFGTANKPWVSPTPQLARPINMATTTWSLVASPPAGMWIHPVTGVITWNDPLANPFQYMLFVRATNLSGSDTEILYLGIEDSPCIADINEDGVVSAQDVSIVLGYWGSISELADVDNNGVVGATDLTIVLNAWGPCF
ncbi:MAG: hypothetical protein EXS10_07115 [Phycisphaerales bacterium]|nr:hypothetical protein [Phycisphaerales bacterium]